MSENKEKMTEKTDEKKTDKVLTKEEAVASKKIPTSPSSSLVPSSKTLTSEELATLDYTDFSTPARMLELGKVLAKSQLVPLKKPEDVVVALMTGKELGLPFVTSVSQIYPINGRPTLGVHIQRAVLLKNNIIIQKIEDAVKIFEFVKIDAEGKVLKEPKKIQKEGKTVEIQVPIVLGEGTLEEQPKNSAKRHIDTRTTYKFTREIKMPSGKFKEVTATGSFTLGEAREAELLVKDVWVKYWRRMLDARSFTIGASEIADDLLLGLKPAEEMGADFIEDTDYIQVP